MKKEAITLPEFRSKETGEKWEPLHYVDSTPDENYVLRILRAHLANCESVWIAEPESPLIDAMNEANEKRAELLRKAIEKL
jgi:hypothetical protein